MPSQADAVIRDTIAAVLRASIYRRSSSPWERFLTWLGRWWDRLMSRFGGVHHVSPAIYWPVAIVVILLVAVVIARSVYLFRARREDVGEGSATRVLRAGTRGRDPWRAAEEAAARGDFTAAAHALYLALLEAAARRGELRLHPSKTVGDYARELRHRSSALLGRFRDFARSYETVIYGAGECDRQRYEGLLALAGPIVRADG